MTDVDGHEYIDYLLGLGPDDPRPSPPRGHQGGARTPWPSSAPASALPYELEIEAAAEGRRRGAQPRDGALHQLGQRGGRHRRAPGARGHRPAPARALRGSLPRLAGRRVLEQPRRSRRGRAGRPSAAGGLGPRRAAGARRHADRALLERPRELPAGHGRARRRDRRGDHRAGHVQHRLHPAASPATSSCCAPRRASTARCSSSTRSSPAFASAAAAPRSGTASCPTSRPWPRASAAASRWPPSAARRAVMGMIDEGRYSHSGTYNANVVQCAAVSATMDVLAEPGLYERQRALGERLAQGLRDLAAEHGIPVQVEGLGTVFQLWFSEHPIHDWREARAYADEARFTRWWQEMLLRGVHLPPEPVREPVRQPRAQRRRRRPDAGGGGRGVPRSSPPRAARGSEGGGRRCARRQPARRPPGGARRLRYQDVMAMIERLIAEERLGPGRPAAQPRRARRHGRREPDHRAPRAGRARAARVACTATRASARSSPGRAS